MSPPQPTPPKKEQIQPTGLELIAPWFPIVAKVCGHWVVQVTNIPCCVETCLRLLLKGSFWVLAFCEASIIFASNIDHPLCIGVRHLLARSPSSSQNIHMSPLFLAGWLINLVGSLIRRDCYRKLDSFFTFELSIRKNHHLIMTGPYAIVRHPSYTGALLSGLGAVLCHLSRGSWLLECSGLLSDSWVVFCSILGFGVLIGTMALGPRMRKEDAMLKEKFGKQWDQWAMRVPYKLFPGLL